MCLPCPTWQSGSCYVPPAPVDLSLLMDCLLVTMSHRTQPFQSDLSSSSSRGKYIQGPLNQAIRYYSVIQNFSPRLPAICLIWDDYSDQTDSSKMFVCIGNTLKPGLDIFVWWNSITKLIFEGSTRVVHHLTEPLYLSTDQTFHSYLQLSFAEQSELRTIIHAAPDLNLGYRVPVYPDPKSELEI